MFYRKSAEFCAAAAAMFSQGSRCADAGESNQSGRVISSKRLFAAETLRREKPLSKAARGSVAWESETDAASFNAAYGDLY